MSAKFFRFVTAVEGEPTGHVGFVLARDLLELFWRADEFGDPHQMEFRDATDFGMCLRVVVDEADPENEEDAPEVSLVDHHVSDMLPFPDDDGPWERIDWSTIGKYAGQR